MIPQGAIWQSLRQRALAVAPIGSRISYAVPLTLSSWFRQGAFTVTRASKQSFVIAASPIEIGGALFSEAAFLLDSACEHSVTVRHQLATGRWYSAAWLVVTFYYWAFFVALSISRMLGRSGWFMSQSDVSCLKAISPVATTPSGAGPYIIECGPQITVSQLEVRIRRAERSRLHDLVWRLIFEEFRSLVPKKGATAGGEQEERLFVAILRSSNLLGLDWPSSLRNLVNYAPGIGYASVRRESRIGVFGSIAIQQPATFADTLDRLENNVAAISPRELPANLPLAVRILVDLTFALDSYARSLYMEVVERHSFDKRWPHARRDFLRQQFRHYKVQNWPYG
jgi:hypothetical protein